MRKAITADDHSIEFVDEELAGIGNTEDLLRGGQATMAPGCLADLYRKGSDA